MGARTRPHAPRPGRRIEWSVVVVSVLVLAAAAYGLVRCFSWVEEQYHETAAYRNASVCPAGHAPSHGADTCIQQSTAHVIDKWKQWVCSHDGTTSSCANRYDLVVRHPQGTDVLRVKEKTYRDVGFGDPVELRLWDGAVTRMEAGGHTETYIAPSQSSLLWGLTVGWTVLGVAVAALTLHGGFAAPVLITWLCLAPPAVATAYIVLAGPPTGVQWFFFGWLTALGLGVLVGIRHRR
ncbi:HPP family protein [Streptomyces sp. NPDC017936]|uniref:HPP family protein n=1 Tax=Streptomyces sp. NPDC017936 TaxID=3365016 RepID=UPI0037931961